MAISAETIFRKAREVAQPQIDSLDVQREKPHSSADVDVMQIVFYPSVNALVHGALAVHI